MAESQIFSLRDDDRLAEVLTELHTDEEWAQFAAERPVQTSEIVRSQIRIALVGADAGAYVEEDSLRFVDAEGLPKKLVSHSPYLFGYFSGILDRPLPFTIEPEERDGDTALWLSD